MIVHSPEQQAIIGAPLRSLRVAAGAGTGKTHVVAARVAALILDHGIEPEEILGITFTNKAAEELADRIRAMLGVSLDQDREITVHTYHGFAADLLREFGALVGVERSAQVVTPTFARQLMSDILAGVPIDGLDLTSPSTLQKALDLAQRMGNNLVDRIEPPSQPSEIDLERQGLAAAVERFQREKTRLDLIDYTDMIRLAHRLIVEHPPIAATIGARFRAVVLDEYQDTDPAQRELLRLLFATSHPVLAVGDEDQTIYEWRGASLDNFRRFPDQFTYGGETAPTLPLSINRRSAPEILELANSVRTEIDDHRRNDLTARPEAPAGNVRLARLATATAEAAWIAGDMARLHQEGIPWSEMAILFRKNASMRVMHQALAQADIPFQVANVGGLLSVPEVADLRAWLQILETPEHGPGLARILTGAHYRLGLGDLATIARHASGDPEEDSSLLESIDRLETPELPDDLADRLSRFRATYRALLTHAQGSSPVEVCRQILDQIGAWGDLVVMSPAAALSARLNLYRFLDLAEQWSPLEGRTSLRAFLQHLDMMEDERVEELDVARISTAEAVTLITVHRAKGLEWPVVYLPALTQGTFPPSFRYDDPFCKAESLPFHLRLDASSLPPLSADQRDTDRHQALRPGLVSQEWRLFYVAVTRAKWHLTLTTAHWYGSEETNKRPSTPSPMWQLAARHGELVEDVAEAPPRPEMLGVVDIGSGVPDPLFPEGWAQPFQPGNGIDFVERMAAERGVDDAYREKTEEYLQLLLTLPDPPQPVSTGEMVTSVTGLVTYAACPRRFYWSEVDRLPRRPSRAARRGVEVHRKIELHNLGMVPLSEPDEPVDTEWEGTPVADPYAVFLAGEYAGRTPVLVEKPFELRLKTGMWVRGRIDAIYSQPGWEIVDFKSGRRNDAPHLLVQLQAYALAVDEIGLLPDPDTGFTASFVYLGGGRMETVRHQVDRSWLDSAGERIEGIAGGIIARRFQPQPGEVCRGCDFLAVCAAGRDSLGASPEPR